MNTPSLAALQSFDAAARHLNFTHAARELGVGQPAVSRQITRLEAEIGVALFTRRPHVRLTEAGRRLFAATSVAFASIAQAVEAERSVAGREITIDVSIGFATCWLLQRLADFAAQHPEIPIRLVTRDLTNLPNADADVSVFYGEAVPGADLVFGDRIVPVVSNDHPLADRPRTVDELIESPLLGMTERVYGDAWNRLFASVGRDAPPIGHERQFTSFIVYREALLQGRGVGLAWRGLMDDDLDSGRLEPVTDVSLESETHGYWVTATPVSGGANVFTRWLLEAATTSRDG